MCVRCVCKLVSVSQFPVCPAAHLGASVCDQCQHLQSISWLPEQFANTPSTSSTCFAVCLERVSSFLTSILREDIFVFHLHIFISNPIVPFSKGAQIIQTWAVAQFSEFYLAVTLTTVKYNVNWLSRININILAITLYLLIEITCEFFLKMQP